MIVSDTKTRAFVPLLAQRTRGLSFILFHFYSPLEEASQDRVLFSHFPIISDAVQPPRGAPARHPCPAARASYGDDVSRDDISRGIPLTAVDEERRASNGRAAHSGAFAESAEEVESLKRQKLFNQIAPMYDQVSRWLGVHKERVLEFKGCVGQHSLSIYRNHFQAERVQYGLVSMLVTLTFRHKKVVSQSSQ